MDIRNQAIAYDFHGDTPFTTPFSQIKPQDIHIYLDLDTKVGKRTCGQNCSHCWFVNYDKVHNKSFDRDEGLSIKTALEKVGYRVFARYTDSFAYNGDFMRTYGPAHNRSFYQKLELEPTDTMQKGDAWTSGRPLLGDNYVELLDLARTSGYGTISITFHGTFDENGKLRDHKHYPLHGVFSGADTEKVVRRIQDYNAQLGVEPRAFRVNIGVTLGRHNHTRESLVRYAHYFNELGVDTVRFNNFTDHGRRHPALPMSRAQIEQVYRDIKWLHENVPLKFQLAVSEDFGTYGVEVMGFPSHVGWCQAGRHLFTVIPTEESVVADQGGERIEKIGDIVACVNIFEPYLGRLVRKVRADHVDYQLEFDHQAIDDFAGQRARGVYKNGCFAKEMLEAKAMSLTRAATAAIARANLTSTHQPAGL